MFFAFNILIIAMVLLIAYWWANQGLFSAIMHLVCVVVAGAIAFSIWEPLVVGLMLRGTAFDDYAWGVTLVVTFVVLLAIFRFAADKLAPANVNLPHWANVVFGFPVGAAAAVLSVGILMIGAGYTQSINTIMGFQGMARMPGGHIQQKETLWAPVHVWTGQFYSMLSAGSLYPTFNNTPLHHYNPDVHFQAASLLRDSAMNGRGKFSLMPSAATIQEFLHDPASNRYFVKIRFDTKARDSGEQLTLSAAQIRLIGRASTFSKAKYVFPEQWTQYSGFHKFDDLSHYITSEPGQAEANVVIEFDGREFATANGQQHPRFLQIRNTRYRLPNPGQEGGLVHFDVGAGGNETVEPNGRDISAAVRLTNDIRPISVSRNQLPPGVSVTDDLFIDGGRGDFIRGDQATSLKLSVKGILEPPGTRIVQVDVSRESPANLFGPIRDTAGPSAQIKLVDNRGRVYYPIGFIHQRPDNRTTVAVNFGTFLYHVNDLPPLPSAGGQPMKLLFSVTVGSTIVGMKLGDVTVGTCNVQIDELASRVAPPPATTPRAGDSPTDE